MLDENIFIFPEYKKNAAISNELWCETHLNRITSAVLVCLPRLAPDASTSQALDNSELVPYLRYKSAAPIKALQILYCV